MPWIFMKPHKKLALNMKKIIDTIEKKYYSYNTSKLSTLIIFSYGTNFLLAYFKLQLLQTSITTQLKNQKVFKIIY